jgi:hypothetical protein
MLKRVSRRDLSWGVLFLLCVVALTLQWRLSYFGTRDQNIRDSAVGVIVGLFIYFLVVWLPERDKRKRVRRNLQIQYNSFKKGCIRVFLEAISQGYDPALLDELKDRERFRQFFTGSFSAGQTRWDAVANGLEADAVHIKSLIVEFEILIAEVRFTLIAVDVENQEVFAFLKELEKSLYRARNCSPKYDGVKSLLRLMASVFMGWNLIDGDTKTDVIADMIEAM